MNQVLRKGAERQANEMMSNLECNEGSAVVGEQGAAAAPGKESSKKAASRKRNAPKAGKSAKKANKTIVRAKRKTAAPRGESKGAKILELVGRAKGATLAEIMKATQWQAHSVRGFLSTAGKKQGLKIESSKSDAGERVYRIVK